MIDNNIFGDYHFEDMIRIEMPLHNTRVWWRRSDGAYPQLSAPLEWLADHDCHYHFSSKGREIEDYAGYRYDPSEPFKVISGTFFINYHYGDVRHGPDPHLYREPDRINGPITGYSWFHADQSDLVVLFKLAFS